MERWEDLITVSEPVSKSYIAAARYDIGTNGERSLQCKGWQCFESNQCINGLHVITSSQ